MFIGNNITGRYDDELSYYDSENDKMCSSDGHLIFGLISIIDPTDGDGQLK